MDEPRSDSDTPPDAGKPGAPPAPDLAESLQEVRAVGRAGLHAASDAAKALRTLISADLSLARSALGRALAYISVAVAFGGSAWMLLMAALTALLHDALGWSWTVSLSVCALLSITVTTLSIWRAIHYFEHTRLQATRRQLARLGIGELSESMPAPGPHDAAQNAGDEPAKQGLGADVPPP